MSESTVTGYELWDTTSRNLLDDFGSEAEALDAVRELVSLNGIDCTDSLALTRLTADGRMSTVAMGDALAALAGKDGEEPRRLGRQLQSRRQWLDDRRMLAYSSRRALQPGGTMVVASYSSTISGPGSGSEGRSPRSSTGVSSVPCSAPK